MHTHTHTDGQARQRLPQRPGGAREGFLKSGVRLCHARLGSLLLKLRGVDHVKKVYISEKKKSFVTYHTQRISKNIVHCDATATLEKISGVKARLSNILGSWRNAGS